MPAVRAAKYVGEEIQRMAAAANLAASRQSQAQQVAQHASEDDGLGS